MGASLLPRLYGVEIMQVSHELCRLQVKLALAATGCVVTDDELSSIQHGSFFQVQLPRALTVIVGNLYLLVEGVRGPGGFVS